MLFDALWGRAAEKAGFDDISSIHLLLSPFSFNEIYTVTPGKNSLTEYLFLWEMSKISTYYPCHRLLSVALLDTHYESNGKHNSR